MVNRNQIKTMVIQVLSKKFGVDPRKINEETSLIKDLGLDSLDVTELSMELEERMGMEIPDSDLNNLRSVGQVIDYIYKKLLSKKIQRRK